MGLMYAIVSVGSVILQGAVNSFGTNTITAHIAARKIDDIFMLPLGTLSVAASTFTSQNYGAGKINRVKQGIRYSIMISMLWSAFSVLIATLLRKPLIHALTGTTDEGIIAHHMEHFVFLRTQYSPDSPQQSAGRGKKARSDQRKYCRISPENFCRRCTCPQSWLFRHLHLGAYHLGGMCRYRCG